MRRAVASLAVASLVQALAVLASARAPLQEAADVAQVHGHWVGFYECTPNDREYFTLEITDGGARLETAAGVQRLEGTTSPQDLQLRHAAWESAVPRKFAPLSLAGELYEEAGVLYGVAGDAACATPGRGARGRSAEPKVAYFIAARAEKPVPRSDDNGLLFKVTGDRRSAENLTTDDCRRYAEWLLSGERKKMAGRRVHTATRDAEAMAALLGHDLFSWTEEDFARMRTISKTAKRALQRSGDADLVRLAAEVRVWHAEPLNWSPTKQRREWMIARVASYHVDTVGRLPETMERIKQGLYDPANVATTPAHETDPTGLAGAWHGYYRCGRTERYLRFELDTEGDAIAGKFEYGPALEYVGQRGALRMKGVLEAPDRFRLEPESWIHQPRDISGNTTTTPIGFAGTFDPGTGRMQGDVLGTGDECTTFTARRRPVGGRPKNADGLLFKIVPKQKVDLSLEDCRRFARWLATGKEISVGGQSFYSLYFDAEAAWEVLGKDEGTWEPADRDKFNRLAGYCGRTLRQSMDLGDQELVRQVSTWSPAPFTAPMDNPLSNDWQRYAQVPLVRAEAEELAAARLDEVVALPSAVKSIDRLDEIVRELDQRRGRLKFLVEERHAEVRATLLEEREALGVRVAEEAARRFARFEPTIAGLKRLLAFYGDVHGALSARNARAGADRLTALYGAENEERARVLWLKLIPAHLEVLREDLLGKGYEKATALFALDREREELAGFWKPSPGPLGQSYRSYLTARDSTAIALASGSEDQLVAWIRSLPPCATAQARIREFAQATFRQPAIPFELRTLRAAAEENRAAYNPHGFVRPDIAGAIMAGHWEEVRYRGAENIGYLGSIMGLLETTCPELPALRGQTSPADAFLTQLVLEEAERLMSGNITERDVVLAVQGYFSGGAAEGIMLISAQGLEDGRKLVAAGCDGLARKFADNFLEFARMSAFGRERPRLNVPHAWNYVKQH